jgi:hypothetical protein
VPIGMRNVRVHGQVTGPGTGAEQSDCAVALTLSREKTACPPAPPYHPSRYTVTLTGPRVAPMYNDTVSPNRGAYGLAHRASWLCGAQWCELMNHDESPD